MVINKKQTPTGVGVGLRACHYAHIEAEQPSVPWFEVLSDNYLNQCGPSLYHLEKICETYPVTLHGVGMSLGSTDPLNQTYLNKIKNLSKRINPLLISDHLCWTSLGGHYFHELLPLPFTDEAVMHVVERIQQVQDCLGQRIMIENVSSYLHYSQSIFTEWEFLQTIADLSDCLILLDINNIYVSAFNNNFDPDNYINGLKTNRVAQFHLAGYSDRETYLLDSHSAPVHHPVWNLFEKAITKFGSLPTIIEWDNHIPNFQRLHKEAQHAQSLMDKYVIPA